MIANRSERHEGGDMGGERDAKIDEREGHERKGTRARATGSRKKRGEGHSNSPWYSRGRRCWERERERPRNDEEREARGEKN